MLALVANGCAVVHEELLIVVEQFLAAAGHLQPQPIDQHSVGLETRSNWLVACEVTFSSSCVMSRIESMTLLGNPSPESASRSSEPTS